MNDFTASNGAEVTMKDAGTYKYGTVSTSDNSVSLPGQPKAWHDAKTGDIWEMTGSDEATSGQYLFDEGRFFRLPLSSPWAPGWQPAAFAEEFSAGRRIWSAVTE